MRVIYEVVGNNLSEDNPTWGKVQNAAVLYADGLTIDKFCGLVIQIDKYELVAEILDCYADLLTPQEFVCNKWVVNGNGLYHPHLQSYGQPFALVLLERREVIENARKESEEIRE